MMGMCCPHYEHSIPTQAPPRFEKCSPRARRGQRGCRSQGETSTSIGRQLEVLQRQQAEERSPPPLDKPNVDLDVLYEDESLLVVNKPHQLLSVATDRLEQDTLHSRCVDYLRWTDKKAWCFIVHRLDKATSGIMVMAKTKEAKLDLSNNFTIAPFTVPTGLWSKEHQRPHRARFVRGCLKINT